MIGIWSIVNVASAGDIGLAWMALEITLSCASEMFAKFKLATASVSKRTYPAGSDLTAYFNT